MIHSQFEERDQEVSEEFNRLIKGFKPEFGNEKHIKVSKLIADNNKKVAKMKEIMNNNSVLFKLREEILSNKVKINYLLGDKDISM